MKQENQFNQIALKVLEKIKEFQLFHHGPRLEIIYTFDEELHDKEDSVIRKLQELGIIIEYEFLEPYKIHILKVNQPKLDKLYNLLKSGDGYIEYEHHRVVIKDTKHNTTEPISAEIKHIVNINETPATSIKTNELLETNNNLNKRKTIFETNGDLIVDANRILNVTLTTADFYFLKILDEKFNTPVGHEELYNFCVKKLADINSLPNYEYQCTPQDFCNQRKTRIKNKIDETDKKNIFDRIIKSTKTQDGKSAYMMTNP